MSNNIKPFITRAALTLALAMLTATAAWAQSPSGNWADYRATSLTESADHNTIYISTAAELALYAYNVNNDVKNSAGYYCGRVVELQADIDLSAHYWDPIGKSPTFQNPMYFNGQFNGNNHTISGLYIDNSISSWRGYGLFGYVKQPSGRAGWIKDLVIENFNICKSDGNAGEGGLAVLAGRDAGDSGGGFTIENCLVKNGYINNTSTSASNNKPTGVILGCQQGKVTLTNNYYTDDITGNYGGGVNGADVEGARRVYTSAQSTFCKKITIHNEDYYYGNTVISVESYDYTGSNISVTPTVTFDGTVVNSDCYTVSIKNSNNETVTHVKDVGIYTLTITGVNNKGYYGSKSTSFYVLGALNGNGTENSPYEIYNLNDWRTFSLNISLGQRLDKYYILKDNVSGITEMVGDANHQFSGSFDGNQKTLTINYVVTGSATDDKGVAPFRYVQGSATQIKDLHVTGTISSAAQYTGGIIGCQYGTTTVSGCTVDVTINTSAKYAGGIVGCVHNSLTVINCLNSATINSTVSGDGTHGGFVGLQESDNGSTINISGSVFNGSMAGTATTSCGGFVGYLSKTVTITNSLFAPTTLTVSTNNSATFGRHNNSGTLNLVNSYYTEAFGTAQGKQRRSVEAGANVTVSNIVLTGSTTAYTTSGITAYSNGGLTTDNGATRYYGSGDVVSLTLNHQDCEGYIFNGYTASAGTLSGSNPYTLTMSDEDVTVSAMLSPNPAHFADNGDGSYTIKTAIGWNVFCDLLTDNAMGYFSGKTVRLGADITVTRMAGGSNHAFTGTFDGGGHTLTLAYGTADAPVDAQFVAPFVETANDGEHQPTFRNLTIAGSIYDGYTASADHNVGGLIGHLFGTVTIEHCTSLVEIHAKVGAGGFVGLCEHSVSFNDCHSAAVIRSADGSNSGFVAWSRASAYTIAFTGCLFDGKLLQQNGSGSYNGGFIGWTGSTKTVTITNSLCAPAPLADGETMASSGSATFARGWNATTTATNCYYTAAFEIAQGKATRTVTAGTDVTIESIALTGTATHYTVSGITAYSGGGLQRGETLYYGSGDALSLTLGNTAAGAPLGYQYSAYTASGGTLNGSTLTMPDANVTISVDTSHPHSTHQAVPVGYVDENGIEQTANAVALDGSETSRAAGTYFVGAPTVSFDHTLTLTGDVTLILADNCHMNVGTSSQPLNVRGINGYSYDLDIYGQSLDENTAGHLNIYTNGNTGLQCKNFNQHSGIVNIDAANGGIYADGELDYNTYEYDGGNVTVNGGKLTVNSSNNDAINCRNVTINGGNVSATSTRKSRNAIYSYGSVAINGGIVEATGGDNGNGIVASDGNFNYSGGNVTATATNGTGIRSTGNITLGWKNADDFIDVSSYSLGYGYAVVKVADGQTLIDADGNIYTGTLGTGDNYTAYSVLNGKTLTPAVVLADAANNATAISDAATVCTGGKTIAVQLNGRTLYKDGAWNTLCLPFDVTLADSPLAGAEAKTVIGATTNAGDLTINFGNPDSTTEPVTVLKAGVPYIIKWEATNTNIVEPVFTGVTVVSSSAADRTVSVLDGDVKFVGYYDALSLDPAGSDDFAANVVPSIYYMTADNTLKHTAVARTLHTCRAYFQFDETADAREIRLNFGEDETTEILSTTNFTNYTNEAGAWYTVDAVKLNDKPTRKGLYIHNGRKTVIK